MKIYKKQIYLFLFISLLIVIGSFAFLFINFRKQIHFQNEILKVERKRILADSLTANLLQLESDKRGFQLTRDSNYLKGFNELKANIDNNVSNLKIDFIGEKHRKDILQIDSLLKLRVANLDSGLIVFVSNGLIAATEYMQIKDKKKIRELLNQQLVDIKNDLQIRLQKNTDESNRISQQNTINVLILLVIFVLLMFAAAFTFKKGQQKILKNHLQFKEAQKKFLDIFENIADGVYQSTVDGKFITANPAMARILGYDSPNELISSAKDIGEQHYVNPDDRKLMGKLLLKYGHLENYEVALLTKDKATVWVSESTRAVQDDKGNVLYYEGTLKDITERKRVEETLQLMQKRYQSIFDNTIVGIYQSTTDGKFLMANPSMARIFGYDSPTELLRSITDIRTQIYADPEERKKMIELISLYDHIENFELQVFSKTKNIIWVNANIRAIRDEKGNLNYFEGILEDITERKKAEEQLVQLSNRLQLAIRATNIGIWDWDLVNDKTEWDDEMYHIYDVDPADPKTITESWSAALHPDDVERVNKELQMAVNGEKEFDTEFRVIWKNKSVRYVKAHAIVLKNDEGHPLRMIGTNADITQRKEAEEEILQLNKSLDQFANITAHDLQEPIRMVSGFLGLLEKRYNNVLDEQGKSYVFRAKDGADRMTVLIRDLLEFSRSGNKAAKKEPVDLGAVMDLVKKDLSIVMTDTGASMQVPSSLPTVTGTQTALYRLFLNLTSNGIKFRKKDTVPEIKLSVNELSDSWEFTLQDNGIGVAEKDQPRLFQAFQRLHRKEDYPGTGLGLVTCKKIVETHGGKIWMTSELGKGTAFHFTLDKNNHINGKEINNH